MKHLLIPALLLVLAAPVGLAQAQSVVPVAGKDYVEIQNGKPLDPVEGKVVVEEFFNYVCPACNGFEPLFVRWAAKLPPYAVVAHIPATFREDFKPYARAYYAAQALGLVDKTHAAVYQAIHSTHQLPGEGERSDEDKIAAFYATYGVDKATFLSTMKSFGVNVNLARATEHMKQSRVQSTPTIVVNGRYLVQGATYDDALRIATFLIEKLHAG